MKPVRQTKRGGSQVPPEDRGDCWSACLASLLEVPIDAVPVPHSDDPEHHWFDETQQALAAHGYYAVCASIEIYPAGYWIAAVPSLNLTGADGKPELHVVVMQDGCVAHDPALGKRYDVGTPIGDLTVLDAFVLVPLELRSLAA